MNQIKTMSVVVPKRRRNPVKWYISNNVGTDIVSLDFGVMRFIDSLHRND